MFLTSHPKQDDDVEASGVARGASPSEKNAVGERSSFGSCASKVSPKEVGTKTTGLPMEQDTQSDDENPDVQAAIATSLSPQGLADQGVARAADPTDQPTAGYSSDGSVTSPAKEMGTKTNGLSPSSSFEESESSEEETGRDLSKVQYRRIVSAFLNA